jgi:hypothetical protein
LRFVAVVVQQMMVAAAAVEVSGSTINAATCSPCKPS